MVDRFQYQTRAEPVLPEALRPEVTLLSKWWVQASEPVRTRTPINVGPSFTIDPVALTLQRAVTLDQWWQPASEPPPPRPGLHASRQQYRAIDREAVTQPEAISLDKWWQPASEPVRVREPINVGPAFTVDPQAITQLEAVTLDKWWQQPSEPVRVPAYSQAALVATAVFVETSIPVAVTLDQWFVQASEPVRLPVGLRLGAFLYSAALPELGLSWWQQASEPVRTRPRTQAALERNYDIDSAALTQPEATSLDKWWMQASEPVRVPARSQAALVEGYRIDIRALTGTVPPVNTWWRQASEPIRVRPPTPASWEGIHVIDPTILLEAGVTPTPAPAPAPDTHDGADYEPYHRRRRIERTPREKIAAELRAAYEGVVDHRDELPDEYQDAVADVVAPFAPTSAPDLPPASVIDWDALAEEGIATIREAIRVIRLAQARLGAQIAEAERLMDEEEAVILLLLV